MAEEKNIQAEEELEAEIVTLTDEDGIESDFEVIGSLELDDNEYLALVPVDGEEDEYIILKIVVENEEEVLVTIDDDEEFDRVADAFDNELEEVFGYDEE
ncbi:MAG TPA: DUF1292 domain-containing protein [Clostridiales bacterium]|jgi:uncharacterized protein YrzB (UPF0473 family)|nr:DUF1292 domain-containing protein [Clostridiales bacterium]HBE12663.1 DUF1292 domain-containing protein [Clostridiales bacterium]HCG35932.1 DUF1292 domain-containing protein [Clostridiales bacterium]